MNTDGGGEEDAEEPHPVLMKAAMEHFVIEMSTAE